MGRIDVVGLGPAGEDLVTVATRDLIAAASSRHLRTAVHPSAHLVADAVTFDDLYETLDTFEEVYAAIVASLLAAAADSDAPVLYAVPGSPVVAEHTVELLLAQGPAAGVEVVVHPAMSFLDLAWARLGVDPVQVGVHVVDGHRFTSMRPADGGAVLVAQCESRFTMSDIKLAVDPAPEGDVVILHHLGLPDEAVVAVAWEDIDRTVEVDHLTSLWIPALPATAGGRLDRFDHLMARLRHEDAWKASQTHDSLKRFLVEEAHEVLEAIDGYDPSTGEGAAELAAELGDLLYQVVFHARLAEEEGWFALGDVVDAIHDKLVGRDHTTSDPGQSDVAQLVARWERTKVAEQGRSSAFDGIPVELPALLRALKVVRKAGALGLELPGTGGGGGGADSSPDLGDRLLAEVIAAAGRGEDPEDALRRRVRALEANLRAAESGS